MFSGIVTVALVVLAAVVFLFAAKFALQAIVSWGDLDHATYFDPVAAKLGDEGIDRYRRATFRLDVLAIVGVMTALGGLIAMLAVPSSPLPRLIACGVGIAGCLMARYAATTYAREEDAFEKETGYATHEASRLLKSASLQTVRR
jgi:hypothetical protein